MAPEFRESSPVHNRGLVAILIIRSEQDCDRPVLSESWEDVSGVPPREQARSAGEHEVVPCLGRPLAPEEAGLLGGGVAPVLRVQQAFSPSTVWTLES